MTTPSSPAGSVISAILRHDDKQTSYKIALLRAINDIALTFPDMHTLGRDVAIPLRVLADAWIGYYWPFVDPDAPIYQGPRARRGEALRNDMGFRRHSRSCAPSSRASTGRTLALRTGRCWSAISSTRAGASTTRRSCSPRTAKRRGPCSA